MLCPIFALEIGEPWVQYLQVTRSAVSILCDLVRFALFQSSFSGARKSYQSSKNGANNLEIQPLEIRFLITVRDAARATFQQKLCVCVCVCVCVYRCVLCRGRYRLQDRSPNYHKTVKEERVTQLSEQLCTQFFGGFFGAWFTNTLCSICF